MTLDSISAPRTIDPERFLVGEVYPKGHAPQSDGEVIDATLAHILAPLSESVAAGHVPENPSVNLLERHFQFFDPNRDGHISLGEGYEGWRSLGFSAGWDAPTKAALTAAVFGTGWNYFTLNIDIGAAMAERRPRSSSGVLDAEGNLDQARFRGVMQAFLNYSREHGSQEPGQLGELPRDKFRDFLREIGVRGIPTQQFKSMLDVLENAGYEGPIRPMHLAMVYSNALLYNARAAIAQAE